MCVAASVLDRYWIVVASVLDHAFPLHRWDAGSALGRCWIVATSVLDRVLLFS